MKPLVPFLFVLSLGACSSDSNSGSNADAQTDVDAAPAIDATIAKADANNTNCQLASSLTPSFESLDASGNGFANNPLDIDVVATIDSTKILYFTSNSAATVPLGTHEMSGQWLDANCTFCLFLNTGDATNGQIWFPISGSIDVTSVANNFVMTGTDLTFAHVEFIGDTFKVEAADDGCTSVFTSFSINTPMQVGAP